MGSHNGVLAAAIGAHGVISIEADAVVSRFGEVSTCGGFAPVDSRRVNTDRLVGIAVPENVPETLGALLRFLRCEAELTLEEVAVAVGVKKPSVWAWENGKNKPSRDKWHALANVLGVAPQMLASTAKAEGMKKLSFSPLRVKEMDRTAMLDAGREMIANAYGVPPSAVRITLKV